MSAAAMIASPAPNAAPLTRHTTGTGDSSILVRMDESRSVVRPMVAGSASSARSAPDENVVAAPVTTITRTEASPASVRRVSSMSCNTPVLRALRVADSFTV